MRQMVRSNIYTNNLFSLTASSSLSPSRAVCLSSKVGWCDRQTVRRLQLQTVEITIVHRFYNVVCTSFTSIVMYLLALYIVQLTTLIYWYFLLLLYPHSWFAFVPCSVWVDGGVVLWFYGFFYIIYVMYVFLWFLVKEVSYGVYGSNWKVI